MHAADHRDRAGLALLVIAAHDQIAMLALGAHDRGDARLLRLHAIGAVIHPARIAVLHHHHVAGADVIAAVQLMPFGNRYLEDVDVLAFGDILQQRARFHRLGRNRLRLFHIAAPIMDEIERAGIGRIAERQMDALDRGEDIGDHAMAARIAGHVVEQHGRIAGLALVEIDDAADLLLAVRPRDVLDLARRFHLGDPAS